MHPADAYVLAEMLLCAFTVPLVPPGVSLLCHVHHTVAPPPHSRPRPRRLLNVRGACERGGGLSRPSHREEGKGLPNVAVAAIMQPPLSPEQANFVGVCWGKWTCAGGQDSIGRDAEKHVRYRTRGWWGDCPFGWWALIRPLPASPKLLTSPPPPSRSTASLHINLVCEPTCGGVWRIARARVCRTLSRTRPCVTGPPPRTRHGPRSGLELGRGQVRAPALPGPL